MRKLHWLAPCAGLILLAPGPAAFAQRTAENPMLSASDGFGLTTGGQSVGLYSQNSARGFSPSRAGNLRIEGLFFDLVGLLGTRTTSGTTMRVGLAAQSYAFPAPTGIADTRLRIPSSETVTSLTLGYQRPYGFMGPQVSLDASVPLISDISRNGGGCGVGTPGLGARPRLSGPGRCRGGSFHAERRHRDQ